MAQGSRIELQKELFQEAISQVTQLGSIVIETGFSHPDPFEQIILSAQEIQKDLKRVQRKIKRMTKGKMNA